MIPVIAGTALMNAGTTGIYTVYQGRDWVEPQVTPDLPGTMPVLYNLALFPVSPSDLKHFKQPGLFAHLMWFSTVHPV